MSEKIKMTVEMDVTPAQALALQAMFEYWTYCGKAGCSRDVAFFVDGDGNFQPNCVVKIQGDVPELTDELRKIAVVKDIDGNRYYDFDGLFWKLDKLKEKMQIEHKGNRTDIFINQNGKFENSDGHIYKYDLNEDVIFIGRDKDELIINNEETILNKIGKVIGFLDIGKDAYFVEIDGDPHLFWETEIKGKDEE